MSCYLLDHPSPFTAPAIAPEPAPCEADALPPIPANWSAVAPGPLARPALCALLLALAGCASTPPPRLVKVPVAVPCLAPLPERPVNRFGQGAWPGDKAAAQAALADATAWERYATLLEGAMAGCLPAPPP